MALAVEAIKHAGSIDAERVRTGIESVRGFVGVTGVFNLSATDHMGLDLSAFRMLEKKDGIGRPSSDVSPLGRRRQPIF